MCSNSEKKVLSILLLKELTHENSPVPSLINKYSWSGVVLSTL